MPERPVTPWHRWLGLSLLVLVFDQITKLVVLQHFQEHEQLNVIPGLFDLTLRYNTGAAFSILADAGGWQHYFFVTLALAATVLLGWMLRQDHQRRACAIAYTLMIGGAIGNLIDRLAYGKVVDFLLFYWQTHAFPAFNVADSALTLGVAALLWDQFFGKAPATDPSP